MVQISFINSSSLRDEQATTIDNQKPQQLIVCGSRLPAQQLGCGKEPAFLGLPAKWHHLCPGPLASELERAEESSGCTIVGSWKCGVAEVTTSSSPPSVPPLQIHEVGPGPYAALPSLLSAGVEDPAHWREARAKVLEVLPEGGAHRCCCRAHPTAKL